MSNEGCIEHIIEIKFSTPISEAFGTIEGRLERNKFEYNEYGIVLHMFFSFRDSEMHSLKANGTLNFEKRFKDYLTKTKLSSDKIRLVGK